MGTTEPTGTSSSGSSPEIVGGTARLLRRTWYAVAGAIGVSLLLAPQRVYLSGPSFFGPRTASIFLVVLCGAAFGLLYARLWSSAATRWTSLPAGRLHAVLTACHVPLLALWLGPFAASGNGPRPHLAFTACVACGVLVVAFTVVTRHGRPCAFRRVIAFSAAAGVAFLFSLALRSMSDGPEVALGSAMVWGLYLLVSMTGWGALVNATVLPGERLDWGQRAAWGLAFFLLVGGLANLSWTISPLALFVLLAAGAGAIAADIVTALPRRAPPPVKVSGAVVALVAVTILGGLFQLAASASGTIDTVYRRPAFDLHDDEQAYLVFPEKMLETGSMGPEPFEARRMLSMGGQSFLQALVLCGLPLRAVHLVEMGVAPLILLGLVLGFGRRHRLDPRLTLFAVVLVLLLPHPTMRGNTSALLTGVVLMVSWFRLEANDVLPAAGLPATALLTALIASGLCALKSTFVPAAVSFFLVVAACSIAKGSDRIGTTRWLLAGGALVMLFDLPWMVSILESSGTLLYPVFGRGFYGGVYTGDFATITGSFDLPPADVLRAVGRQLLRLVPILVLVPFARGGSLRRPAIALAFAAAVSVVLFVVLGDPEINRSLARYAFPVSCAALLALVLSAFRPTPTGATSRVGASIAVVAAVCFLLMHHDALASSARQLGVNLVNALNPEPAVPDGARAAMAALERSVPDRNRLLATLERPYLLDFRHRQIFIMSLPGMASPPPGIPILQGGEAVADYLMGRSIRFLAYGGFDDTRRLLNLTEKQIRERYPHSRTRWVMLRYHQHYHRVVGELADSRRRLYEDGRNLVLDLAVRETTFRPSENPGAVAGMIGGVWTGPEAVFRDITRPPSAKIVVLRTRRWRPDSKDPEALGLKVSANGLELPMIEASDGSFAFRLGRGTNAPLDLAIHCSPFDPTALEAAGPERALGIAVDAIILGNEKDNGSDHSLVQQVSGDLVGTEIWRRSGFYRDRAWTDGDGVLDRLRWPVPQGAGTLVLSLRPMRPERRRIVLPGLRLLVNGLELRRHRVAGHDVVFRLYQGLDEINRIRILSPTVSPRELDGSRDRRELGVPVRSLSFGGG